MEKTISIREWATVKRVAASVQPMVQKKNNILAKVKELSEEFKALDAQIQGFEGGIKALCGGLTTENLVHREVSVVEGKFDKDGRPLKQTAYKPNSNVCYDKNRNVYVITLPDPETPKTEEVKTEEPAVAQEEVKEEVEVVSTPDYPTL